MLKNLINKTNFELGGINPTRTPEESYVHNVNIAVTKGEDISEIYDHKEYVECMHTMSIHGDNVKEPEAIVMIAVLTAATGVGLMIGLPFII